jgi:dTMP kinase
MKGKIIVLEGGESSGKSTQLKLLTEKLEKEGKKVMHMHFPKHDVSFGKVVDAYLRGEYGDKSKIPPEFVAMLYMSDFYESKFEMEKAIDEGKIILLSRYFSSTLSYQTALTPADKREEVWQWIRQVCERLPQPDLTLVLYVPVEVSEKFLDNANRAEAYKKGAKRDQHEVDLDFQRVFMKEYDRNIDRLGWKKIDCVRSGTLKPINEISELVWKEVEKVLKK